MSLWFEKFAQSIRGKDPTEDLIGAGSANALEAIAHYRYQHQAKIKDAIEESFPSVIKLMGKKPWNQIWKEFWSTNPSSPRSLDYFSEVFLKYFVLQDISLELKELARFELLLESFPWSHEACEVKPILNLNDKSKIQLGSYEVFEFSINVIDLYQDLETSERNTYQILFWLKDDGVNFRAMEQWEINVLKLLPFGVNTALEGVDVSENSLSEFFQWLGKSALIQEVHNS